MNKSKCSPEEIVEILEQFERKIQKTLNKPHIKRERISPKKFA